MIIGTGGFVTWFELFIYNKIRKACKNIFAKLFVHVVGLLSIITGIYFFIIAMPSFTSIAGMFLILIGLVIFVILIGIE